MSLSENLVSRTSLFATAFVAAFLGVASVTWQPGVSAQSDASTLPVVFEDRMEVIAPPPQVVVELVPSSDSFAAGEPVAVVARITNNGDEPIATSGLGSLDLTVKHTASPAPMNLGAVTFLAVADVVAGGERTIAPGATLEGEIELGSDAPFDLPGQYRIGGTWSGAKQRADIAPFEVSIAAPAAIAERAGAGRTAS